MNIVCSVDAHMGMGGPDDNAAQAGHLVSCPLTGNQYGDHASRESLLVPQVVGTLSPGAHPGSYNGQDAHTGMLVAHSLRAEGFDASEDGTGRGTPIVMQERMESDSPTSGPGGKGWSDSGVAFTLEARTKTQSVAYERGEVSGPNQMGVPCGNQMGNSGSTPVDDATFVQAFTQNQCGDVLTGEIMHSLATNSNATGRSSCNIQNGMAVRRLMPIECERLQGFPDDFTRFDKDGKELSDSARYRMIGNAVCVNVARWIGRRIVERT